MIGKLWTRVRGILAAVRVLKDPEDLPEVFKLVDALDRGEEDDVLLFLREHQVSQAALAEQPHLFRIPVEELRAMPSGSLGHEVARFMDDNGFEPGTFPQMGADQPNRCVAGHLYETHDLWHTLTGFDTDLAGELGLQAFYLAQLPSRVSAVFLAIGMAKMAFTELGNREAMMDAVTRGWIMGRQADLLFGARWDRMWERPLVEVRQAYRIAA